MRCLLLFFAILFAATAHGATRYVNPAHSNSGDSGAGASTAPYKTISFAMKQLVSGDRLIIASGTYRETLSFKYQAQNVVVEGSAGTLVKGSDVVTGWESAGGGRFVRRNWTVNTQQVFVNGVQMKQIGGTVAAGYQWPGRFSGSASSMTPESFYYDAGSRSLYVKPASGSLSGKTVEASVRQRLAIGTGLGNVQLRNISFMHSNTSATTRGAAVALTGSRVTVDRVSVIRADATGIAIRGNDNIVQNSIANYCGQLGMAGSGRNMRFIGNETSYNNTRGFNQYWEAAGMKLIGDGGIHDSEVRNHKALYNAGDGIWFDGGNNTNNKIRESVSAYNSGNGIHYEISSTAHIYNNLVFGNKLRGIYLANGSNSLVAHNLVVQSGQENISSANDRRVPPSSSWAPRNNKIIGNISAWGSNDILRLAEKQFANISNGNLFADNATPVYAQETSQFANRATGLKNWQGLSGQDKNSWEKVIAMSSTISSALNARQANVNWSSLKSLASQYRSPPTPLDGGLPPGPLNGMW
ncbi:MAG: right-handed parallel beta-helix repeat-containing protein [Burkholderiales bacterium]